MKKTLPLEDAIAIGAVLRRLDPKLLKAAPAGRTGDWWQGNEPYLDVFIESDAVGVAWLQASARGRVLTWEREGDRLRTGTTNELSPSGGQPASKLVTNEARPAAELVAFVVALLDSAHQTTGDVALGDAAERVRPFLHA